MPVDSNRPRIRLKQPENGQQERRFSGTIWTNYSNELSFVHRQTDILDYDLSRSYDRQITDVKYQPSHDPTRISMSLHGKNVLGGKVGANPGSWL